MTTKEIIDIVSIAKKRGWISFPKPEGELTKEQKDALAGRVPHRRKEPAKAIDANWNTSV